MKARFGAILCLLLGAILIQNGLSDTSAGAGAIANPCFAVGISSICPQGSLVVKEKTDKNGNAAVDAPSSWELQLTSSNCYVTPANQAKPVPDNGSVTFSALYVYADANGAKQCEYTLTQTAVAPFTTTIDPPGPYTFLDGVTVPTAFKADVSGLEQDVTVTNKAPAPKPSSSSASPTKTRTASPTATSELPTPSASSSPVLATTGPHTPVRGSLIAGIALCVLGGALLFMGRRPRGARHT